MHLIRPRLATFILAHPCAFGHRRRAKLTSLATAALVLALTGTASAHHGRDFLLARTAELPHPGQVFLVPRQDVVRQQHTTILELEPSLIVGATERIALEVHSHVGHESGHDLTYESTAAAVHLRLTSDESVWGAGVSMEYEIAHPADATDRLETRLVVSRQTGESRFAVNIFAGHGGEPEIGEVPAGALDWNYAAGFRRRLASKVDWGVEGQGRLDGSSAHELLVGIYTEPTDRVTINVGAGAGIGSTAPGATVRTAIVLRLH